MNDVVIQAFYDELEKIAAMDKEAANAAQLAWRAARRLQGPIGDALRRAQSAGHAIPEFGLPSMREAFTRGGVKAMKAAPAAVAHGGGEVATKVLPKATAVGGATQVLPKSGPIAERLQAAAASLKNMPAPVAKATRPSWSMDVHALRKLPTSTTLADVTRNPMAHGAKIAALMKQARTLRLAHQG